MQQQQAHDTHVQIEQDPLLQNNHQTDMFKPFSRLDYPVNCYEYFKMIFGALFLLPFRVVSILLLMILFYVTSFVAFGCCCCEQIYSPSKSFAVSKFLYRSGGILCRIGLFIMGFYTIERRHVAGKSNEQQPYVIVCNHVSMLDAIVLLSEMNIVSFLIKSSSKDTCLWGTWMQQTQCLFVSDTGKDALCATIAHRQAQYEQGNREWPQLVIFPEGTTSNGSYLLPFHKGAFMARKPVQPVFLRYDWQCFNTAWETIPVITWVFRLLTQFRNFVEVTYMPVQVPAQPQSNDPLLYAEQVRQYMYQHVKSVSQVTLPLQLSKATRKDKLRYHDLIIQGKMQWWKQY